MMHVRLRSFHASCAGSADGIALYTTIRGQVEKLAALYVINGMDATTAAKQAANDLLNFKYVYQDGYRVPAPRSGTAPPESLNDIRLGAYAARAALGTTLNGVDLNVKPSMDTFGHVYTPAQLAAETAAAKRSGQWATNGDESGLWYVYKGQVVHRPDGTPLQLTWAQLASLAANERAHGGAMRDIGDVPVPQGQPQVLPGALFGPRRAAPAPTVMGGNPPNAAGQPGFAGAQSGVTQTQPPPPDLAVPPRLLRGADRAAENAAAIAEQERRIRHGAPRGVPDQNP